MVTVSRKDYIKYRKAGFNNSLQTLYLYYQHAAEETVEPIFFSQAFPIWCQKTFLNPYPDVVKLTINSLDNEYGLQFLRDEKNRLIKII